MEPEAWGLKVRSDPYDSTAGVITVLADNTAFSAVCAVRGRDIYGNNVWHRISAPVSRLDRRLLH